MKILSFPSHSAKCPVGVLAQHPAWGCVRVHAADGLLRTLEITDYRPLAPSDGSDLPAGVELSEVLYSDETEYRYVDVHVTELTEYAEFRGSARRKRAMGAR